jgi:GntR family transcriptional regulator
MLQTKGAFDMARPSGGRARQSTRLGHFASREIPLYYQLAGLLREKIGSSEFGVGEKIPTEAELGATYGISRITVRQALASLEEEGLVRREAGRGTFVAEPPPGNPFTGQLRLDGTLDDLISMGLATRVQLLDLKSLRASTADAEALGIGRGDKMVRCVRLRFFHDEPYSYILNDLPHAIGSRIPRSYLKRGSILQFLEKRLGIQLRGADQFVRATLADATVAPSLGVLIGAPLLFVDRIVYDTAGSVAERVRSYYRSDIYSFSLHMKRTPKRSPGEVTWSLRDTSAGGAG